MPFLSSVSPPIRPYASLKLCLSVSPCVFSVCLYVRRSVCPPTQTPIRQATACLHAQCLPAFLYTGMSMFSFLSKMFVYRSVGSFSKLSECPSFRKYGYLYVSLSVDPSAWDRFLYLLLLIINYKLKQTFVIYLHVYFKVLIRPVAQSLWRRQLNARSSDTSSVLLIENMYFDNEK